MGKGLGNFGGIYVPNIAASTLPSKISIILSQFLDSSFHLYYTMHPLEPLPVTSSTVSTSDSGPTPMSSLSRYSSCSTSYQIHIPDMSRYHPSSGEPDPFRPATDISQCTHCGAQISVGDILTKVEVLSQI